MRFLKQLICFHDYTSVMSLDLIKRGHPPWWVYVAKYPIWVKNDDILVCRCCGKSKEK